MNEQKGLPVTNRQTTSRQARATSDRYSYLDSAKHPMQGDVEVEDDDRYYSTKSHTTAVRYDRPGSMQGRTRDQAHPGQYVNVPPRRSAQAAAPTTTAAPVRAARRPHWLLIAGLTTMFVVLVIWTGTAIHDKWLSTMDDWTYTSTFRTFSIDYAVGHNGDSAANPSHFIVQNDHTRIVIIEFPKDDPGKVIVYYGPSLLGSGQDMTPVTLSFQTDPQTGRIDMVLHVEGQGYVFTNNGTKFVAATGQ